jgi:hypothetical protein
MIIPIPYVAIGAGESYLVVLVKRGHTADLYFGNLVVETVD